MSTYFAGLDWASQTHAVCLIDERGGVCEQFEVAHTAAGLTELARRLRQRGGPPIAIERLVGDNYLDRLTTIILAGSGPAPGRSGRSGFSVGLVVMTRARRCPAKGSRTSKCTDTSRRGTDTPKQRRPRAPA